MMHSLVALITILALLLYFWMGLQVARARHKHGIEAPATTGHPEFERRFRVQGNTGEWLLMFLPSLWLFAIYVGDAVAAGAGVVWLVGRVLYMNGYVKDPKARGPGFAIQALATFVLMFGALGYVLWGLIHGAK